MSGTLPLKYDHKTSGRMWMIIPLVMIPIVVVFLAFVPGKCEEEDGDEMEKCGEQGELPYLGLGAMCVVNLLIAASFMWMRVTIDAENVLRVRFGPLPLLNACGCGRGTINLNEVQSLDVQEFGCVYGYGIRLTQAGLLFRVGGSTGVVITTRAGKGTVLCTTDTDGLLAALRASTAAEPLRGVALA
mmetsp:Transcript_7880/g.27942  ORF Transcript_7880/g.27942 Transcript_7880/m.27942 type:complete len:187 (-) Transcript_7880:189-749(-)|eukprot:CAMPEP_0203831252 /NCGR_PEP_ID=MMETSP0115-20131106/67863_1 /ASSEMBLY_ACC=CAM_ASM_000227 /TAXON_ID=33651 /ORGANISM="Bicosoecid sp, Strain ms1" /LENGTH=186 /DNA_ID=CAMNT_0050740317 /DNA_START=91 /DNA_END=651 /DNA_ORIENTATION=-